MKRVLVLAFAAYCLFADAGLFALEASGTSPDTAMSSRKREMEDKARRALEELRRSYADEDLNGFFDTVSDEAYLNWQDLKFRVAKRFGNTSQTDLLFSVDHALVEGDKVDLKTHWQKRAVNDKSGSVEKSEGDAEFIFMVREEAELLNIRGDSPF